MLRILVISLVIANLLLLGFQSSKPSGRPDTKPAVSVARDSGIPTIHLFSEMMQDQGLLSSNRQCFTLGPFHSSEDRDDLHTRLMDVSTSISERQTEALVEKGYWVYMPPYASLLEANRALLSLQALGLNDLAVIYDGEWRNAISLGYFLRQENAQARKKDLENRGFTPMIRIRREAEPRYWLDYEQNPGSGLIALDMQNRPNDFMQRPVPCPETEFSETLAVASQDAGQDSTNMQAPVVEPEEVTAQGQSAEETLSPENPAEVPERSLSDQDAASGGLETVESSPAGQAVENSAGNTQDTSAGQTPVIEDQKNPESPTPQEPETTTDSSVDTPAGQGPGETPPGGDDTPPERDSGSTSAAAVEAAPQRAVGTGPDHIVSTGPVPTSDSVTDQGVGTPDARASGNEPVAGEETSTDTAPAEPQKEDAENSTGQTAPTDANTDADAETGDGNGTGDGR